MPSGRGQGQLYVCYASSCLPALGRVVCYGKFIFLTECRVMWPPWLSIRVIILSNLWKSSLPKGFSCLFGQNGHINELSVKVIQGRVSQPPILSLTFKVILPFIPITANLLWTGLQENRSSIPDVSRHLTLFYRVQKFPGHTRPQMQCASGLLCQELKGRGVKLRIHLRPIQGLRKRGILPPSSQTRLYRGT